MTEDNLEIRVGNLEAALKDLMNKVEKLSIDKCILCEGEKGFTGVIKHNQFCEMRHSRAALDGGTW